MSVLRVSRFCFIRREPTTQYHRRQPPSALQARLSQAQQRLNIPLVIAGLIHRRFKDERLRSQLRVVEDSSESFGADLPLADVRVAVETGARGALRVVGMEDR